jgi:hypothetical protein
MTQGTTIVRNGGRGSDLDQPHIDASVELRNIPVGITHGSGAPIMVSGLEQRVHTLTQQILRLEQLVSNLSRQIESLRATELEESSETIHVRPLSERRVNVKVRRREAAGFRFIEDGEETASNGTED